ncbi:hypothetical protein GW17_00016381 [Ensete ventricosum]|nr:hypothetical protein GW17_00016381 [Ensete ventricosum]
MKMKSGIRPFLIVEPKENDHLRLPDRGRDPIEDKERKGERRRATGAIAGHKQKGGGGKVRTRTRRRSEMVRAWNRSP